MEWEKRGQEEVEQTVKDETGLVFGGLLYHHHHQTTMNHGWLQLPPGSWRASLHFSLGILLLCSAIFFYLVSPSSYLLLLLGRSVG